MSGAGKGVLIFGVILFLVGLLFFILPAMGNAPEELSIGGWIVAPMGLIFGGVGYYMIRMAKRAAFLQAGLDGKAELLQWWQVTHAEDGEIRYNEGFEYELEVTAPGKSPYKLTHRQSAHFNVFTRFHEGMILPIKIHPQNPEQILIVWDDLELPAQGGAEDKELKDRLSELEEAYKGGLITKEEYESKRGEILKKL